MRVIAFETRGGSWTWGGLALLVTLGACSNNGSSPAGPDAGTVRALQVSFDKATSTLGATNVQDALDELAARPIAEAPIGSRIKTIVKPMPFPGLSGSVTLMADCSDPSHDVALGGACGFIDAATLVQTSIANDATHASFVCGWSKAGPGAGNTSVTVVCLTGAR
jgi:hypothetical protein